MGRLEQKVLEFEANIMIRTSLRLNYINPARAPPSNKIKLKLN